MKFNYHKSFTPSSAVEKKLISKLGEDFTNLNLTRMSEFIDQAALELDLVTHGISEDLLNSALYSLGELMHISLKHKGLHIDELIRMSSLSSMKNSSAQDIALYAFHQICHVSSKK